jgi:cytochrome P450
LEVHCLTKFQTTIGVFQWTANNSASNFHEPDLFAPERWLPNAPAKFANDSKDVVQPFSTGPRNCIGKKYVS